jgi:diacylglycerol kinase family enzyme
MTFLHQEVRPKVFLTLDDEREIEVETMLVVVSTKTAFGKNLMRVSDAPVLDGMLDISVFPDFGKAELLRYYADMMDGRYSGDGTAHHYQARKVQVKSSPKLDVMADGVMLGNGKVTIKVRTNMLRVITKMQAPTPEKVEETEILEQPFSLTAGKNHRDISVPI